MSLFLCWLGLTIIGTIVVFAASYGLCIWLGATDIALAMGILSAVACVVAASPGAVISLIGED